jgi:hypothetical protein
MPSTILRPTGVPESTTSIVRADRAEREPAAADVSEW